MAQMMDYQSAPPVSEAGGVYYRREDFPGLFVRAAIVVIDLIVLVVLLGVWLAVADASGLRQVVPAGVFAVGWLYMVLIKWVVGTAGYLVFRVRVVDLKGRPAGLVRLTWRTGVGVILNPVVDLLWAASDGTRQPLRDKLSGTYVVRRAAVPAGRGEFVMASVFLMGGNYVYREVKRAEN